MVAEDDERAPEERQSPVPAEQPPVATRTARGGPAYRIGHAVLGTASKLIYRPHVFGRTNVPKTGPVILASNHLAFIDSVAIMMVAPRRIQFLAKAHYFMGKGVRGWISRTFFTAIGAVGVQRGAGHAAQRSLEIGREILEAGGAFGIYPEGTRSKDGRLYRGRTGVAWLALTTGAPVVPVGLIGTDRLQPHGSAMPRFHRVTITFGTPLDLSHHGSARSQRARRRATDEVMAAIHALTGQEEAGAYNEVPPATTVERMKRLFRHERYGIDSDQEGERS